MDRTRWRSTPWRPRARRAQRGGCPGEVLSARAFYESDVRESSYRSPIDAFLPLYFSEAHFAAVKASGLLGRVLPPQPPRVLRVFGRAGSGPPEVNYLKGICSLLGKPHGVAVDGAGNVFVADRGNHRIQVFDAKGEARACRGWLATAQLGRAVALGS